MNILTFDIEDWYNCDFISKDFDWDKYEVRIYDGVNRILLELEKRNITGTFFCLGWIAERHPAIIKEISKRGHHIGCHSYQHELSFRFDKKEFERDVLKAKKLLEGVIGKEVNAFRAPGFSITKRNIWALSSLAEMGFKYDCSLFPGTHDYGGFPDYGDAQPKLLILNNRLSIKEFPISAKIVVGKSIVFSGGGFFRFFPYFLIKKWAQQSDYMMTYFHPRDFDVDQPVIKSLPLSRRFKSYVGIRGAFSKFQNLLNDFEFCDIEQADTCVNWSDMRMNINDFFK